MEYRSPAAFVFLGVSSLIFHLTDTFWMLEEFVFFLIKMFKRIIFLVLGCEEMYTTSC